MSKVFRALLAAYVVGAMAFLLTAAVRGPNDPYAVEIIGWFVTYVGLGGGVIVLQAIWMFRNDG